MGLLIWIIVGIVAGMVACRLSRRTETVDYVLNIIVGIVGACAGGFITNLVIYRPPLQFNLQSLLVSLLATGVFLVVLNALRR